MKETQHQKGAQEQSPPSLKPEGGTTPVPTALIDRVMPALRDTELRVLLVVVRQTLGWQVGKDPYLRKERDWLTQSQLMRRTGRESGAVARAVDVLVRRGLIDVLDGGGRSLPTPAERRRCLGRLYYRLHRPEGEAKPGSVRTAGEDPFAGKSAAAKSAAVKSKHTKPHTTKDTVYKNKQSRQPNVDKAVEKPFVIRSNRWVRVRDVLCEPPAKQQSSGDGEPEG